MEKIKKIISSNIVLFISLAAALVSMIFVPPCSAYKDYIDFPVLVMLFCLMGVVAAFRKIGVFDAVTDFLLNRTSSARMIAFIMMNLCFFSSMLVTNDVALLTFVPLCIGVAKYSSDKWFLIKTVVIETAAANLGSMMTPVGNPQNLFLYSHFNLSGSDFIKTLLPVGILSYTILSASVFMIKNEKMSFEKADRNKISIRNCVVYSLLFAVCLLAVAGIVNKYICLIITAIVLFISDRNVFRKIDYSLLATFVCFFVFVGNLGEIESIRSFISETMSGREVIVSALISQVISNVPAAIMLSGFTDKALLLLAGVNIGGLGTPVASLASLISFRCYSADRNAQKGKYMLFFLIYNFAFLAVLLLFQIIFFS